MKVRKRTRANSKGVKRTSYFIDYVDPYSGIRKREELKAIKTRAAAEEVATEFYAELCRRHRMGEAAGPTKSQKQRTLKDVLDWHSKRAGIQPRTRQSELCHRKPLERILGPNTLAMQITTADVERFKQERSAEVGNRTVNFGLELLRASFNRARREDFVGSKANFEVTKLPETRKKPRVLSPEEINALIAACLNPNLRDAVILMAGLGLRPGEIGRLTWNDVESLDGMLWVTSYKRGATGEVKRKAVPLAGAITEMLKRRQSEAFGEGPPDRKAKIFTSTKGMKGFNNVKLTAKRAGIDHWEQVSAYTLRHSFATRILAMGATVKDTQELLRHSNPALTLSMYAQESMPSMRTAVRRLSEAIHPEGTDKAPKSTPEQTPPDK